jgi:type IV pilus assembly protein PilE
MELMVVIVIVAILAAVAVPLYINYVKDAQRTEAKGAIGAIVTAEQTYYQSNPAGGYTDDQTKLNVDLNEVKLNWDVNITNPGAEGFVVTMTGKAGKPTENLSVEYTYSRTNPPANPWVEQ